MHLPILLLLSTAFVYGSAKKDASCLELFYKVVFRNATTSDIQELTNCFEQVPTLNDRVSSLTSTGDIGEFATKCFTDFSKYARRNATAKQIGHLTVCGWDTVKIMNELHNSGGVIDIPLNAPAASLVITTGEKFASQCLHAFERAITGPKSAIEIEALNMCGARFLKQSKHAVDRYVDIALQQDPSLTRRDIDKALDSVEEVTAQCITHVLGVLTGSEEAREGSLAYCGGAFMTTTRLFVDLALGRDPMKDEYL